MKKFLIFFSLLLVAAIPFGFAMSDPFKVTDPNDPNFDPAKFEFNDYRDDKEMAGVLKVLFPIGTSIDKVDAILVGSGQAIRTSQKSNPYFNTLGGSVDQKIDSQKLIKEAKDIIHYGYEGKNPTFVWMIVVFYDDQDHVMQIICRNEVVFEERE